MDAIVDRVGAGWRGPAATVYRGFHRAAAEDAVRIREVFRHIERLLDAVVVYLPSPLDVPPVRGIRDGVERTRSADLVGPLTAPAFKVSATPTGRLTFVRIYSGTIGKGDTVWDANAARTDRTAVTTSAKNVYAFGREAGTMRRRTVVSCRVRRVS